MKYKLNLNSIAYQKTDSQKTKSQDSIRMHTFDDGISVGAVADGLGSKSKSDIGSLIAVQTSIKYLHELLANSNVSPEKINYSEVKRELLQRIQSRISQQAQIDGVSPKEYETTLLVFAVAEDKVIFGQIGDGYIVTKKIEEDDPNVLFDPKDADIEFGNVTRHILNDPSYMNFKVMDKEELQYFFISTDGTDKLYSGDEYRGYYTPFINNNTPQEAIFLLFANSLIVLDSVYKNEKIDDSILKYFSDKTLDALYRMLVKNDAYDDVSFAFVNPNDEGVCVNASFIIEKLIEAKSIVRRKKEKKTQEDDGFYQ